MSILSDILERSKKTREIIGFRKYDDENNFWCGYVIDYNETLVTIQHFSPYGKMDGVIIEQLEDIESFDFDDDYSRAMQYVIEHATVFEKEDAVPGLFAEGEEWKLQLLQQFEGLRNKIISVDINSDGFLAGFIEKVSDEDFILKGVGKLGEDAGLSVYKIEDITRFKINDLEDRKRLMLYNWRKSNK